MHLKLFKRIGLNLTRGRQDTGTLLEVIGISYLDYGDVFTSIDICPDLTKLHTLNMCDFLPINYALIKLFLEGRKKTTCNCIA